MSNGRYFRRRIQRNDLNKRRKAYGRWFEANLRETRDAELVAAANDMLTEFGLVAVPPEEYDEPARRIEGEDMEALERAQQQ